MPRIGQHGKGLLGSLQLNFAPAESADADAGLEISMGDRFGGKHEDGRDEAGCFTTVVVMSDYPNGYDPGRFFLPIAQMYVTCAKYTCINFSGRHFHGSCPLTSPDGNPDPAAIRFVMVAYPPAIAFSDSARFPLGILFDGKRWTIGREVRKGE